MAIAVARNKESVVVIELEKVESGKNWLDFDNRLTATSSGCREIVVGLVVVRRRSCVTEWDFHNQVST